MNWDGYLAFTCLGILFICINTLHWKRWRATIDPVNKAIADMDRQDKELWVRLARAKRLTFRRFTMNKHKIAKSGKMKCPTCDHEQTDGKAEDYCLTTEGWEQGSVDVCENCYSEFYAYQEDGHVFVEEV